VGKVIICCDGSTVAVSRDGANMHGWLLLTGLSSTVVSISRTASTTDICRSVELISESVHVDLTSYTFFKPVTSFRTGNRLTSLFIKLCEEMVHIKNTHKLENVAPNNALPPDGHLANT